MRLSVMIEEALETLLVEHFIHCGKGEEEAFAVFSMAVSRRCEVLTIAGIFNIEGADSLVELAPEAVLTVDNKFGKLIETGDDEALVVEAERAILAFYLGAVQALGRMLLEKRQRNTTET